MGKLLICVVTLFALAGCVTAEQRAARNNLEAGLRSEVQAAKSAARFECNSKVECEKAFSLAKIFVRENSEMRVQSSDETAITTYEGSKYGYCGMTILNVPGAGETGSIIPAVSCMAYMPEAAPKEIALYKKFAQEMAKARPQK